jgi:uncharacterized protein (DUF1015 family)
MANVYPFRAWRYSAKAGPIDKLATQPYDTIPPELEASYRGSGPHNLVWLIRPDGDYARAAARLDAWTASGILEQDRTPALYGYEQRFRLPGTGEELVRRGFIGLSELAPYGRGVYRHERTLEGPVADRLELLRHTRAQFGSIFVMYPDAEGAVERLLGDGEVLAEFSDHQETAHRLWRIGDAEAVQAAMREKPLVIVDGHHRYEAALQYGRESRVMMTFVSLHSLGLRTLAAHRVVADVEVEGAAPVEDLRAMWAGTPQGRVRFGVARRDGLFGIEFERPAGALNLSVLHERVLRGIAPEQITPVRGMENAIARAQGGGVAFLVEPLEVSEVARLALAGTTLPQKSTDFYPKLASGLTIFRF